MFPAEWIYKGNYEFTITDIRNLLGVPKTSGYAEFIRSKGIYVAKGRLHGKQMKDFLCRVPVDGAELVWCSIQEFTPLPKRTEEPRPKVPSQLDRIEAMLLQLLDR